MANFMYFTAVFMFLSLFNIGGYVNAQMATTMISDCDATTNCDARGVCVNEEDGTWSCKCDDGYATYPEPEDPQSEDAVYCQYKQKEQLTAFLLSFFLGGCGAGRFYVESWTLGALKISFCMGLPICLCCVMCFGTLCGLGFAQNFNSDGDGVMAACGCVGCCIICIYSLGVFAWCLTDIILFGINDIPDGNGIELASW